MKWWKKFWKLRRQDDRVKVILMFLAGGIVFFIYAGYNSVLLYKMIQNPTEYVLAPEGRKTDVQKRLSKICEWDEIAAASFQTEKDITLKYQDYEETFSCIELSEAYMEAVYGVKESGAMKTFYMNKKAYRQLCRESGLQEKYEGHTAGDGLKLSYTDEAGPVSQAAAGAARVVLVKQNMPKAEPYIFCKKGVQNAVENMLPVRIFVRRQEIE